MAVMMASQKVVRRDSHWVAWMERTWAANSGAEKAASLDFLMAAL